MESYLKFLFRTCGASLFQTPQDRLKCTSVLIRGVASFRGGGGGGGGGSSINANTQAVIWDIYPSPGVHISGDWNRGVPLYTEVSSF